MKHAKVVLVMFIAVSLVRAQNGRMPRNIIIMVGDGMGIAQVTAGHTYKGTLALDKFKYLGLLLTHAAGKDYITDSAAAATALSTGVKTYNGAVGVTVDTLVAETLFERAKKKGKKTGLVVACSITHATPACFVAHVPRRSMEFEIAEQITRSSTDVCLGGGWGWFLPKSLGGRRPDGKNLVAVMQQMGYAYVSNEAGFHDLERGSHPKILGLFADNHVGPAQERKPSLREMTKLALESLKSSGNGFVLLVEGSQIDWAGHDNESDQIMIEMADFDETIGEVLDFASKDGETLVMVTADHETGGYSLVNGSLKEHTVQGKFTTGGHTGAMVPLFAFGPKAEEFTGIQENSRTGSLLISLVR